MFRKACRKIKSRSGSSLAEMLAAIAVTMLATGLLAVTISLAVGQYHKIMRISAAKVLSSTIASIVENELAFTDEIVSVGDSVTFKSKRYGLEHAFFETDGDGEYGRIQITGFREGSTESIPILGNGVYNRGLYAKIDPPVYDPSSHYFCVTVCIGDEKTEYLTNTFYVMNVNALSGG